MYSRLLCCPMWRGTIRKQLFWWEVEKVAISLRTWEEKNVCCIFSISIFICSNLQLLDNDPIFIPEEKYDICYLSLLVATTLYKLIFFALHQLWCRLSLFKRSIWDFLHRSHKLVLPPCGIQYSRGSFDLNNWLHLNSTVGCIWP